MIKSVAISFSAVPKHCSAFCTILCSYCVIPSSPTFSLAVHLCKAPLLLGEATTHCQIVLLITMESVIFVHLLEVIIIIAISFFFTCLIGSLIFWCWINIMNVLSNLLIFSYHRQVFFSPLDHCLHCVYVLVWYLLLLCIFAKAIIVLWEIRGLWALKNKWCWALFGANQLLSPNGVKKDFGLIFGTGTECYLLSCWGYMRIYVV